MCFTWLLHLNHNKNKNVFICYTGLSTYKVIRKWYWLKHLSLLFVVNQCISAKMSKNTSSTHLNQPIIPFSEFGMCHAKSYISNDLTLLRAHWDVTWSDGAIERIQKVAEHQNETCNGTQQRPNVVKVTFQWCRIYLERNAGVLRHRFGVGSW